MKKKTILIPGLFVALGLGTAICFGARTNHVVAVRAEDEVVDVVDTDTDTDVVVEEEKTPTVEEVVEKIKTSLTTWDIKTIFTPQNILAFLSVLVSSGFGLGLIKIYAKYKTEKTITREALEKGIAEMLPKISSQVLDEVVKNVLSPLAASVGSMEEAMTVFAKCLALSQENTPEARLAILEELGKIKIKDESVIAKVDETIRKAIEETQRLLDEKIALLKSMETFQKTTEVLDTLADQVTENKDDGTSI